MTQTPESIERNNPQYIGPQASAWQRVRGNRAALVSMVGLGLALLLALVGPLFGDPTTSFAARVFTGLRTTLLILLLVEVINVLLGGTLGLLAGYFGGMVDAVISGVLRLLLAFPGLLLPLLVAATWGATGGSLVVVAVAISFVTWPLMARLVRNHTRKLREQHFVAAARALGASDAQLIVGHIARNLGGLLVAALLLDALIVLAGDAVLSLLGIGAQPNISLGTLLRDGFAVFLSASQPLTLVSVFVPLLLLILLALCFWVVGNAVQDAVDFPDRT